MMEKNCMNCLMAVGKAAADGQKVWCCKFNGFAVNARMHCEEWNGYKATAMCDNPVTKQNLITT